MTKKPRKVGSHEISPYQGQGGHKQMLRAQARKRRQVRRGEDFNETFGPWAVFIVVGAIAAMGVVALAIEMNR